MHRARRAVLAAFTLTWSVTALALATQPVPVALAPAAAAIPAVAWPTSSGLLIAEVVTGGASASDEYFELTNAGSTGLDLDGLEIAYASSAGASATKRVGWTAPLLIGPGRHLLIANSAGIFAAGADATYSAGIAATGGALVLRPTGGAPIDAVAWGDATNAFVEASPAAAPPAGSSIERGPGGPGGNVVDSNDNAADWLVNGSPAAENLAAPARPAPGAGGTPRPSVTPSGTPTATPTPTPTPTTPPAPTPTPTTKPSPSPSPLPSATVSPAPTPSPTIKPSPTPLPTPSPTTRPSPTPEPSASPTPTASPSPVPTPTPSQAPTPVPSPSAVPSPLPTTTPTPSPATISIATALQRGGQVTIAGVVTAGPSLIDGSGRLIVVQDDSAAVEVRLPAASSKGLAGLAGRTAVPGSHLLVAGTVGHAYGAPRIAATTLTFLGTEAQPVPVRISTAPGAALEWRLLVATGRLDTVHRLGQRWRADLVVGSIRIPIVGLTGAQILVSRLFPGRMVQVVGILRRAYPTALDQRFAIEPRSIADLTFAKADPVRTPPVTPGTGGGVSPGSGSGTSGQPAGVPAPTGEPRVNLRDLGSLAGRLVEVSGIVTGLEGSTIDLDDGTATGRLVLTGAAAPFLSLVEVGDPLEVDGRVGADAAGPLLLVTQADAVRQAGDPGTGPGGDPGASPGVSQAPGDPSATSTGAGASPTNRPLEPGLAANETGGGAGTAGLGLLQALAMALLGALLALAVVVPIVRRTARTDGLGASGEAPRA